MKREMYGEKKEEHNPKHTTTSVKCGRSSVKECLRNVYANETRSQMIFHFIHAVRPGKVSWERKLIWSCPWVTTLSLNVKYFHPCIKGSPYVCN